MSPRSPVTTLLSPLLGVALLGAGLFTIPSSVGASDDLHIEITKKGLGKEVVITQGTREWFMLIEVTPENSVVLRQEKEQDRYLVDESETHDRPMTLGEVDAAIADYVNSVKARAPKK
jgi:regulation of enolase protein 1 (concanavalin A-like superfamily)